MAKRISATEAKNNFGGLLEDVTAHGSVEIVRHGRLVAIVLSPRAFESLGRPRTARDDARTTHMIQPALARAARLVREPDDFDDAWE